MLAKKDDLNNLAIIKNSSWLTDKHKETLHLLTSEFSAAVVQCLDIDGVVRDEAPQMIHRHLIPLDPDLFGLMSQYWQGGTRHWLWNTKNEVERGWWVNCLLNI